MKKLIITILVLILLITVTFVGYTLIKSKQAKTPPDLIIKEGILKTKIGNEYQLDTGSGLVSLTSKQINLTQYMKTKIKVTGTLSGNVLSVTKVEKL